eukprot:2618832-Pyramimonas_sp.AAC.1
MKRAPERWTHWDSPLRGVLSDAAPRPFANAVPGHPHRGPSTAKTIVASHFAALPSQGETRVRC